MCTRPLAHMHDVGAVHAASILLLQTLDTRLARQQFRVDAAFSKSCSCAIPATTNDDMFSILVMC